MLRRAGWLTAVGMVWMLLGPHVAFSQEIPKVTVSAPTSVTEGDTLTFTFTRTQVITTALDVHFNLAAGRNPQLGEPLGDKEVTFGAGETTATYDVTTIDDSRFQEAPSAVPSRVLNASIIDVATYMVGRPRSTTTRVRDNDQKLSIAITVPDGGFRVAEGASSLAVHWVATTTTAGQPVSARRFSLSSSAITGDQAAESGVDYQPLSETVSVGVSAWTSIVAGGATRYRASGSVTFQPVDDSINEPDELLHLVLGFLPGDRSHDFVNSGVEVTIVDDDEPAPNPEFLLSATPAVIEENGGVATVTVTVDEVSGTDRTIDLSVAGTAVSGTDYRIASLTLTLAANETTVSTTVTGVADDEREDAETVRITAAHDGFALGLVITIVDNDESAQNPGFILSATPAVIEENGGVATVTVTANEGAGTDRAIDLSVAGTAVRGTDYRIASRTLMLAANETTVATTVTGMDDDRREDAETVRITAAHDGLDIDTVIVTIADDDATEEHAPVAVDDVAETNEDTAVTIAVLANDSDPDGDALRVKEVSAPEHGAARLTGSATVVYTPEPDYHGTDRFTYTVGDGAGLTVRAAVTVTVRPVNDPPVGTDDVAETDEDTAVTIVVLANDRDPDGDALSVEEVSAPEHGTARLSDAGTVEYTPEPDYHGTDRFTYVAGDGAGLTSQAAVIVTVRPVNDPPQTAGVIPDQMLEAGDGPASLDLGLYFEDRDGDLLTYTAVASQPTVALSLAGSTLTLTVDRPGAATVTVTAQDSGGLTATQAFLVTTSDRQARGVVEDTLAAMGRGHLASARATLGRRMAATGDEESRVGENAFLLALGEGSGAGAEPGRRWTVWGQLDVQAFQGERSRVARYDGDLRSAYVGVDTRLGERWLAGVAVARSRGAGDWSFGSSPGRLTTRLTSVQPYLRWSDGGTSIWATAGGGSGSAENERSRYGLNERSDLGLRLGLIEVRRRLATVGPAIELGLRGDASWAHLATATGEELIDSLEVDLHQFRIGIDVSRPLRTVGGTHLEPFGEVHARRDGGSGQTGVGLEVAGGLRVSRGLFRVEGRGRLLALHAAENYRERGAAVTLSVGEGARRPGWTLSLSPRWGAPARAGDALWRDSLFQRRAPAASDAGSDERAFDARVGYGLQLRPGGLLTPFGLYSRSQYSRRVQVGFLLDRFGPLGLEASGERRALAHGGPTDYRVSVLGSITRASRDSLP